MLLCSSQYFFFLFCAYHALNMKLHTFFYLTQYNKNLSMTFKYKYVKIFNPIENSKSPTSNPKWALLEQDTLFYFFTFLSGG